MDPLDVRHVIEYDTACEILKAAGRCCTTRNRQSKRNVSEEHQRRQILRAAKILQHWKKNHVPISVFNRLKPTTISQLCLLTSVTNQLNTEPTQPSLSNEIDGNN